MRSNNRSLSKYLFNDVLPRFLNMYPRALSRVIIPRNNNVFGKTPALSGSGARYFRERTSDAKHSAKYTIRTPRALENFYRDYRRHREKEREKDSGKLVKFSIRRHIVKRMDAQADARLRD